MSYTREEWVNGALEELGVVGSGQEASAEDAQTVDRHVNSVINDLVTRSVWSIGDPDTIDDGAYNHLCVILAQVVARKFGQEPSEQARLMAENRLRELGAETLSYQPLAVDYF